MEEEKFLYYRGHILSTTCQVHLFIKLDQIILVLRDFIVWYLLFHKGMAFWLFEIPTMADVKYYIILSALLEPFFLEAHEVLD